MQPSRRCASTKGSIIPVERACSRIQRSERIMAPVLPEAGGRASGLSGSHELRITQTNMLGGLMRGLWATAFAAMMVSAPALACEGAVTICAGADKASFALIQAGKPASVLVDPGADPAVRHAADGFAEDLERVSGAKAARAHALAGVKGRWC